MKPVKPEEHSDAKWAWMMDYCKRRGYSPDQSWAWKIASGQYDENQKKLRAIQAETSCWYCQLGIGSGRLSLRDVPEPPRWRNTLCEKHIALLTPPIQKVAPIGMFDDRLDFRHPWDRDEEEGNMRDPNPLPPEKKD